MEPPLSGFTILLYLCGFTARFSRRKFAQSLQICFYFHHVTYRVFGKIALLIHPLSRKVWRCALNFDTFSTYTFKLVNHPHPTRYVLFNRFDVFVAPSLA
jgi:hypothetical protein